MPKFKKFSTACLIAKTLPDTTAFDFDLAFAFHGKRKTENRKPGGLAGRPYSLTLAFLRFGLIF